MRKLIILTALAIGLALIVGLTENYFSNPTRGCGRYDATKGFWGYNCSNGRGYYIAK